MSSALREARIHLTGVSLKRGPGSIEGNLQIILKALWECSTMMGTLGTVNQDVFRSFLKKANGTPTGRMRYITELEKRGCITVKEESSPGRPLLEIRLKMRKLSGAIQEKSAKRTNTQERAVPALVRHPAPITPQDRRGSNNSALVCVDVGNFTGARENVDADVKGSGRRILPAYNVNWRALFDFIKKGPPHESTLDILESFAYLYDGLEDISILTTNIRNARFNPVLHYKPDTDPLMAGDIGFLARDALDEFRKLTIVLVAGDGDYNRVLFTLKRRAKEKSVSFKIWVISWRSQLNHDLKGMADYVTYVENIPDLMLLRNVGQRCQGRERVWHA